VQEALAEMVGAAKECLQPRALVGLGVPSSLKMDEEVVGPKGKHDPDRIAMS
jgi:hypothetical protein